VTSRIADLLAATVDPLRQAFADPGALSALLAELGVDTDLDADTAAVVTSAMALEPAIDDVVAAADALASGGDDVAALLAAVVALVSELAEIPGRVDALAVPAPLDDAATWRRVVEGLPVHLLVRALEAVAPWALGVLVATGVLEPPDGAAGLRDRRLVLRTDRLAELFTDPGGLLRTTFGWGGDIQGELAVLHAARLGEMFDRAVHVGPVPPPIVEGPFGGLPPPTSAVTVEIVTGELVTGSHGAISALVAGFPDGSGAVGGLYVAPLLWGATTGSITLTPAVVIDVDLSADGSGRSGVVIRPGGAEPANGAPTLAGDLAVRWQPDAPTPLASLGGLVVTVDGVRVAATSSGSSFDPRLTLALIGDGLVLRVDPSAGDSFLTAIVGEDLHWAVPLALSIGGDGLHVDGAVGLAVRFPLALELGPVTLSAATVELGTDGDTITIGAGVDLAGTLGPLSVTVTGIGAELTAGTGPDPMGLGVDLALAAGFRFPTGIGLALDLGIVTGGGYLEVDADAGRYVGVLDLDVLTVGISAFVLVETQRPDIDGWSMLLALYIEVPAIQLGFGFTLNGVGGLAGINRTLDPEALGAAVRGGTLGQALFPADPVAQAATTIATLESIFPPADGSYVFGPIVKIGWGTPTLVDASLGIVIAVPDLIIAVLGSVTAVLPRPELELVAFRLDVAGVLDAGRGTLAVDAGLHDSHVVGFAVAGDMALRADFADARSFLLSLGGFHPEFDAPAGFPTLQRLSLGINAGSVLEISFRCYGAITSNTVQFGASFDLWASVLGFEVAGGTSFDALIQFSPFELRANMGFYVSVQAIGFELAAVYLDASLVGPNPWHVVGTAEFRVLGVKKSVRVDELIGDREGELAPPIPDLLADIVAELNRPDNWTIAVPGAVSAGVVLRAAATGVQRARPDATIEVHQTVVPLDVTIERFGNAELGSQRHFTLAAVGGLEQTGSVTDWFAPAHYFTFTPAERLAQPSFAAMVSGIRLGSEEVTDGAGFDLPAGHQEFVIDPEAPDQTNGVLTRETQHFPLMGVAGSTAFRAVGDESFRLRTDRSFVEART
jgi:Family of unknown function (DUF6603)